MEPGGQMVAGGYRVPGRRAWIAALAVVTVALAYLWFRPNADDLYPDWLAVRAFLHGGHAYADYGLPFRFQYPPSFLVILAPLGLVDFATARQVFLLVNAAAIGAAVLVCFSIFEVDWRSPFGAFIIVALAVSAAALITLIQGNVNGLLVLGEAVFLRAAAAGRWRLSGLALGMTLAIKPILFPLLFLPAAWRRFDAILVAAAAVVLPVAVALLLGKDTSRFFTDSIPYILHGESGIGSSNTSIAGAALILGAGPLVGMVLRAFTAALVAYDLWVRLRSDIEDRLKIAEASGLLMLGVVLTFSFSSQYHAIYLLPLAVSAAAPAGAMRSRLAWLGLAMAASPHLFALYRLSRALGWGASIGTVCTTAGFGLLLITLSVRIIRSPARQATPV